MDTSAPTTTPDDACRRRYIFLERECREKGLNPAEIQRSKNELAVQTGSVWYLKEIAYRPTGLAFGCPVPDTRFTRRLWYFSHLVQKRLTALSSTHEPVFAFVPSTWYHVTLVNRTHFDVTPLDHMVNGRHSLSPQERRSVQESIAENGSGPIQLHFFGLVLTSSGRLIAPGFPSDDRLFRLRYQLASALPQLQVNMPETAHIKLGHVLIGLKEEQLHHFLDWLAACGQHVTARISFRDLYTPTGQVIL